MKKEIETVNRASNNEQGMQEANECFKKLQELLVQGKCKGPMNTWPKEELEEYRSIAINMPFTEE